MLYCFRFLTVSKNSLYTRTSKCGCNITISFPVLNSSPETGEGEWISVIRALQIRVQYNNLISCAQLLP